MKWTKELDEKLIELINEGKKHLEIAHILQTTKKSVSNRCDRLGLRIITTKEYKCKNCGNVFISYIKEEREFCSRSCSNSFSNKNRKLSEETKKKISKTLSNKNINQKLIVNKKKILRKCRFCNLPKVKGDYERSNVWTINPETKSKHLAPYPEKLSDKIIQYYSFYGDTVLDPFLGSGTTLLSCEKFGRIGIGYEIHKEYIQMSENRIKNSIEI